MKRRTRWLVPAAVAAVIAVGAVAPGASADLPAKTPAEVLVLAQEADVTEFSGTVTVRTDLGLPPGLLDGEAGMLGDGERTVRLWRAGPDQVRVSVASGMNETTLVRQGDQVTVWDSSDATLTRMTVPEHEDAPDDPAAMADPTEMARTFLDAVGPTTQVSAGEPTVVAGREAYELMLVPTQEGTLVGEVSLAVDASTGAVLGIEVVPVGRSEPAVAMVFTSFDPKAPSPDVFDLAVPPGSTVEDVAPPTASESESESGKPDGPGVERVGEAWTSVLVLPADAERADLQESLPPGTTQSVDGGEVLRTALVTVLLADDGRVLLGAVTPQVLLAAAGG